MKNVFFIIVLISFFGCKKEEAKSFENFTFFTGNIHTFYYLKFNQSDTVYYLEGFPYEKKIVKYSLMTKLQKQKFNKFIEELEYPKKDSVFSNKYVDDGTTFAFSIENNDKTKRILIHENSGPKKFWKLGEWINKLKEKSTFKTTQNKVKFDNFDKIIAVPPPPIVGD